MNRRLLAAMGLAASLGSAATVPSMAQDSETEGRVEVASSGVALTLPDDWIHAFPSPEQLAVMYAEASEFDLDEETKSQMQGLEAGEMVITLVAFETPQPSSTFPDRCLLMTAVAGEDLVLEDWAEFESYAWAQDDPSERPTLTYLELPVGRVARLDYILTVDPEMPVSTDVYLVPGDETQHWLQCQGIDRPEDDWLSIAESFEFLPEEA